MSEEKKGLTYRDAGVDIDAGNALVERIKPHVRRTLRPEVLTGLGGFGGLFALDCQRYRQPVLVSGTDGVGTKLKLAGLLDRHDGIGIDLVAMCVNDILTVGAEPLFFLDYFATGKLDNAQAERVIAGIAEGCRQAGCALIGGETAEMPDMYAPGEYDLAGFVVGVVERDARIDGQYIEAGHWVLGVDSSGPHSNGYSLIRRILEHSGASLDQACGDVSLGEALMAPTRIYVREVLTLLERMPLPGLAHITGGGLTENVVRVVPEGLALEFYRDAWQWPPVFKWLQQAGGVDELEMLRTFNCGIGLAVIVPATNGQAVCDHFAAAGLGCRQIGMVTEAVAGEARVRFV